MSNKPLHITGIREMSKELITEILNSAFKIKENPDKYHGLLRGKILSLAFWEPSTRTRLSFESAMLRLGGQTMGFSSQAGTSIEKGESLSDTVTMLASYSDAIVIRHPKRGSAKLAARIADRQGIPIISGGSGSQEHPTQAILDVFTIKEYHEKLTGLNIGIMGDLRFSRTISSLLFALSKFGKNTIYYLSHPSLTIQEELLFDLTKTNLKMIRAHSLSDIISELDVLYTTRLQKERFPDEHLYNKVKDSYKLNSGLINKAREDLIIMHPLPRVDEIPYDIDRFTQAKYFEQAKNGVYTRMALLLKVMKDGKN